jgi:hypothetical protein
MRRAFDHGVYQDADFLRIAATRERDRRVDPLTAPAAFSKQKCRPSGFPSQAKDDPVAHAFGNLQQLAWFR